MFSPKEASTLKQEFWTAFGQYMSPVSSIEDERVNWINYKTGEKNIHFRMNADNKKAFIALEFSHPDPGIQEIYFEQLKQLQSLFNARMNDEWDWQLHRFDESGKVISQVFKVLDGVSIFKKEDWPLIISFFKPRLIALDQFWSEAKYSFELLR